MTDFRDALNERGVGQHLGEPQFAAADANLSAGEAGNATIETEKAKILPSRPNHPRSARGIGQRSGETHARAAAPTNPAHAGGVGQRVNESHSCAADANFYGGHMHPGTPLANATAPATTESAKSTGEPSRANSFDGQVQCEAHLPDAVEPATRGDAKPDCPPSRASITVPGDAGEASAIFPTMPLPGLRSSQPSGRKSGRGAGRNLNTSLTTPHASNPDVGQFASASHKGEAGEGAEIDGLQQRGNRLDPAVDLRFSDPLIAEIVEIGRLRTDMMRAMQRLDLQAQAMLRRYIAKDHDYSDEKGRAKAKAEAAKAYAKLKDGEVGDLPNEIVATVMVFRSAIEPIEAQRVAYEKHLRKLAKQLPVYEWAKSIWGLGELGLAKIVAQAGNLSVYKSASAVWKRMGLAVIDGERQRKVGGADALVHCYSPQRRSEMWNIGGGIIGGMGLGVRPMDGEDISLRDDWSPYQKLFVERCRYEVARDPEAHARPVTKAGKESYSKHAANRAKRYVEKRLLRDLRAAWRRSASNSAESMWEAPTAINSEAA